MPVFLDEKTKALWLDPKYSFKECFRAIMDSDVVKSGEHLEFLEVSSLVNSIRNQTSDCIMPK